MIPIFVPHFRDENVINKDIIYSDTVLPLKDLGSNLKVTTLSNVSEISLENCLNIIFKNNPDVVFNTIQYSRNDEKVYFYTDKEISTKEYEELGVFNYKPINSKDEILKEIEKLLISDEIKDSDCISLLDLSILFKGIRYDFNNIQEKYKEIIKTKLNYFTFISFNFDYESKTLQLTFYEENGTCNKVYFSKKNGDLHVSKSINFNSTEILGKIGFIISNLYDDFIVFSDYNDRNSYKKLVIPVNSNFNIDIDYGKISIFVRNEENLFDKDFNLYTNDFDNLYLLECNSNVINEVVNVCKEEIFRKIFVKISDCPNWCQSLLYEFRINQLIKQQKIEEEIIKKEAKKQKILEIKRKIFPFFKK